MPHSLRARLKNLQRKGELTEKDISIDHFVPWSYVANDEIWNLHPTTKSINSAKSNNLPRWEAYFKKLSALEYQSYQLMWKYDGIHVILDVAEVTTQRGYSNLVGMDEEVTVIIIALSSL